MRTLKLILCAATVLAALAFAGVQIYTRVVLDTVAPVISMDADSITVRVSDGPEALLAGVTAWDDRDGDLTGEVRVSHVSQLISGSTAKVNYVVFDRADHMATASRTVCYSDYTAPRFSVVSPLVFGVGEKVSLVGHVVARDSIDGNITGAMRLSAISVNNTIEGIYHVTLRVTNSVGDSSKVTLPIIIRAQSPGQAQVELNQYLVYLKTGEEFDPEPYFKTLLTGDGGRGYYSAVSVTDRVDTSVPGIYEVSYDYTAADGEVAEAILTVVVEEGEVEA